MTRCNGEAAARKCGSTSVVGSFAEAPSSSLVRTPPFQGGSTGSNPVGATPKRAGQDTFLNL